VGKRAADADSDRLLPDRDVEEPRQLAGAESLLDLLLEAPEQQHLPEKPAQGLLGDPAALLDFCHGRDSTLRAMSLVEQFRRLSTSLPDGWQSTRLRLIVAEERDSARAAALLGPTNPGQRGKVINFATARGGAGVGPDGIRDLLRRLRDHRAPRRPRARRSRRGSYGGGHRAPERRRRLGRGDDDIATRLERPLRGDRADLE